MIGKQVGHYVIRERLGAGGMAVVYRAEQPSLARDVAVKVLTGPLAGDAEFVQRFRREAMAAGGLGHPNILTVFDAGTMPEGLHYIAMEYAPGGTLRDLLARGPLSQERAVELAAQIADALNAAHRHGIVHRDLKPTNILMSRDGRSLLMDFGVAQIGGETRLTRTGVTVGTPEYMSPEQAQGLSVDERSDVYALGVMLFEMLTGNVPFSAETPLATLYRHVHDPAPRLNEVKRDLPTWLAHIVEKALAKQPAERFFSAAEMAEALRAGPLGAEEAAVLPPVIKAGLPAPASRKGAAGRWVVMALLALLVVAGGTYGLFSLGAADVQPPTEAIHQSTLQGTETAVRQEEPSAQASPATGQQTPGPVHTVEAQTTSRSVAAGTVPTSESMAHSTTSNRTSTSSVHVLPNHAAWTDFIGTLWVAGEVQNDTQQTLRFLKIDVELLDTAGQQLKSEYGYVQLSNLPPGEKTCFTVHFKSPPAWHSYQFSGLDYSSDGTPLTGLTLMSHATTEKSDGYYEILGEMNNDSDSPLRYVEVIVTFYTASGKVALCEANFVDSTHLEPGQTSAFSWITPVYSDLPVDSYRLQVDGEP